MNQDFVRVIEGLTQLFTQKEANATSAATKTEARQSRLCVDEYLNWFQSFDAIEGDVLKWKLGELRNELLVDGNAFESEIESCFS